MSIISGGTPDTPIQVPKEPTRGEPVPPPPGLTWRRRIRGILGGQTAPDPLRDPNALLHAAAAARARTRPRLRLPATVDITAWAAGFFLVSLLAGLAADMIGPWTLWIKASGLAGTAFLLCCGLLWLSTRVK